MQFHSCALCPKLGIKVGQDTKDFYLPFDQVKEGAWRGCTFMEQRLRHLDEYLSWAYRKDWPACDEPVKLRIHTSLEDDLCLIYCNWYLADGEWDPLTEDGLLAYAKSGKLIVIHMGTEY
ncbi:hypothetical protein ColTof3_04441 [Colletotrichum tofieldiae]|nr:hypothetical protein ColTof3_04441 [Colletotrichum tofieldiae]